jgi:PAS domain S-box-containing protein
MGGKPEDNSSGSSGAAPSLGDVYASAPIGLCCLDRNLRYLYVNDALAAINGLAVDAHFGRSLADVLGGLGQIVEPVFRRALETGQADHDVEISGRTCRRPNFGENWSLSVAPVFDASGQVVAVNGAVTDISRRKQIEALAAQAAARLSFVMEAAAAGDFDVDLVTGASRWSKETERLFGFPPGTRATREQWESSLHPEDQTVWRDAFEAALADKRQEFWQDYRIIHPVKGVMWLTSRSFIAYGADGTPLRVSGINIDITQLKEAQFGLAAAKAEAERANLAKTRLVAAASHDLRQPLHALGLYCEVLAAQVPPAGQATLSKIKTCVVHLSGELGEMLELARLDLDGGRGRVEPIALEALLARLAATMAPIAEEKGLRLRCVGSCHSFVGDERLFARIVENLVANAIRYTQRGGVLIGCRRRGGRRWLQVVDSGIGIDAAHQATIFEEFFQVDNPERNSNRGSGLGLAIAKRAADALGLCLTVQSVPGKGSIFSVELPA